MLTFEWKAFVVSLLTYTPTNIAAWCVLAAFSGGCASPLVVTGAAPHFGGKGSQEGSPISESEIYMRENPVSSMLRGFVVYVAFLAGVYVGTNAPFATPLRSSMHGRQELPACSLLLSDTIQQYSGN